MTNASNSGKSKEKDSPRFSIEGYFSHLEGTRYKYSPVVADLNFHREKGTLVAHTANNRDGKYLLALFGFFFLFVAVNCLRSVFYPVFLVESDFRVGTIQNLESYNLAFIIGLVLSFVFASIAFSLVILLFAKTAKYEKALESKITKAVEKLDLEANLESWLNLHHGLSCENLSTVARKLILLPSEVEVQLRSLESNEPVAGKLKVETPFRIFLVKSSTD